MSLLELERFLARLRDLEDRVSDLAVAVARLTAQTTDTTETKGTR